MKHLLIIVVFTLSALSISAQDFKYDGTVKELALASLNPEAAEYYPTLKKEFIDHGENFTPKQALALMAGYIVSDDYGAEGYNDTDLAWQEAEESPLDTIKKYGPLYMEANPTSISLYYGLWKAFSKSGDIATAEKYQKRFTVLCEAIASTNNGKHFYFVPTYTDAWAFSEFYKQKFIPAKGYGMTEKGQRMEIVYISPKEGEYDSYWFYLDHIVFPYFSEEIHKLAEKK